MDFKIYWSLALNVSTDFASMYFIHFAKVLRTLLTPARTRTRLRLVAFSSHNINSKQQKMAPARFERAIFGLGNHCSILLSYEAVLN